MLNCAAGCATTNVVAAIGLTMSGLFDEQKRRNSHEPRPASRIVETHSYTDADDAELFQVTRFEPKGFAQRHHNRGHPKAKGNGWAWTMEGVQPVLYRLPKVLEAVKARTTVYVVGGERDVHALVVS